MLQRREEHFRSLIESALDMVAIVQPDAILRYASPSHQRVLGWRPEELVGVDALSFVALDDQAVVREMLRNGVGQHPFEYRFRHKDGSWRIVESYARNLSHVAGVGGIVVNSRDVTDRHQFERTLAQRQPHLACGGGGIAAGHLLGERRRHGTKLEQRRAGYVWLGGSRGSGAAASADHRGWRVDSG